jgi:hypothetical protein
MDHRNVNQQNDEDSFGIMIQHEKMRKSIFHITCHYLRLLSRFKYLHMTLSCPFKSREDIEIRDSKQTGTEPLL